MSNMSYCRFRNTVPDMRDCWANIDEPINDEEEERARKHFIELCREIAREYIGEPDVWIEVGIFFPDIAF